MKACLTFASGDVIDGELKISHYPQPTNPDYKGPDKHLPTFYEWAFYHKDSLKFRFHGGPTRTHKTHKDAIADFERFGQIAEQSQ